LTISDVCSKVASQCKHGAMQNKLIPCLLFIEFHCLACITALSGIADFRSRFLDNHWKVW